MKKILLGVLLFMIVLAILMTGITIIGIGVLMMFEDVLTDSIKNITHAIVSEEG